MDEIICNTDNAFSRLQEFFDSKKDWLFGFLTYDLKNELENLSSANADGLKFPAMHFFQPEYVFIISGNQVKIGTFDVNPGKIMEEINACERSFPASPSSSLIPQPRITKEHYLKSVNTIKAHIHQGDIYEMNFCQEFFAEGAMIHPAQIYESLNAISEAPFSVYYKLGYKYLACASPERFLKKSGNELISQPIKGTIKRGSSPEEDRHLKKQLLNDEKERSENVMIVDLVRNDLSKVAERGSVEVEELFGIYSFRQVHQMISTVKCQLREDINLTSAIRALFPMGSMTGAPKIRAMQLIEQYESTCRGLYSGSVGYITPEGNFDLNVVIRSILYNSSEKYLSFMVGSAITAKANAEAEYEECLLKAKAMFEALR